jgi:hypothetical protein
MYKNYRLDNRTESQFKKDIKNSSLKEAEIAVRICQWIKDQSEQWPKLIPTGIDFTGDFIKDGSTINASPDYQINGISAEITRADVICAKAFHQKQNKVQRCLKNDSSIVFVNGYEKLKIPNFIWLDSKQIKRFTDKSIETYGESKHPGKAGEGYLNKAAYKYDLEWFKGLWKPLPILDLRVIPKEYKEILDLVGYNAKNKGTISGR